MKHFSVTYKVIDNQKVIETNAKKWNLESKLNKKNKWNIKQEGYKWE